MIKLADFISEVLDISKSEAKRLVRAKAVILNDDKPTDPNTELKHKDRLKVRHRLYEVIYK